ncbi:hypothetical protein HBI24_074100 [Parastagonospora nodorum]|nr:hypothetical protein HBH51_141160 [Parastagonospora nodorum]KAH4027006.1 hypothetical protein HBI09_146980 [Parastagonospora nodorum]KAH4961360.1 hypothetical protein HBI78_145580 [Parastagonospora nodorum]KAH4976701.1 hypothetical protein HBI77_226190 [Parastagonospora nodorum]KAH5048698.1 hypothetical protein HBH96_209670 [Parastagonospora nodorum]
MRTFILATSLFTALAAAQTMSMTAFLATNPDLSEFGGLLRNVSSFAGSLNGRYNITIVIPTNEAFEALSAGPDSFERRAVSGRGDDELEKLLSYHVLNGTYTSADFTSEPKYASTLSYTQRGATNLVAANFTGPRAGLVKNGTSAATVLSSEGRSSEVVEADIQTIPGIVVHKINRVLTLPSNSTGGDATPTGSATGAAQATGGAGRLGGGMAAIGLGFALAL